MKGEIKPCVGNDKWAILPLVEKLGENYKDILLERCGEGVVEVVEKESLQRDLHASNVL